MIGKVGDNGSSPSLGTFAEYDDLNPVKKDGRRLGKARLTEVFLRPSSVGGSWISVTNLQKLAIARKQNLAGVVNENKTGRMWGASRKTSQQIDQTRKQSKIITIIDL